MFRNPFTDGVTLSANAWYMRLLHWAYGTEPSSYKNLCPLFWSVVGTIFLLPLILICRLCEYLSNFKSWKKIEQVVGIIGKWFLFCNVVMMAVILLSVLANYLIVCTLDITMITVLKVFGAICGLALTIPIFVYFFNMIDRDQYGTLGETKMIVKAPYLGVKYVLKPFNLFGHYITAVYHKCCPFINWKN